MRIRTIAVAGTLSLLAITGLAGTAQAAGDAEAGEKAFNKCRACHSLAEGKRMIGPSLNGLFNRKAGNAEGFKHSADMTAAGAKIDPWDETHFKAYIATPSEYIGAQIGKPKATTKMVFPGIKSEKEIEDLYAFLEPYLKGEKQGK